MDNSSNAERTAEHVLEMLRSKKDLDLDGAVHVALTDTSVLGQMMEGLVSKNETYRYNCFKVLLRISQEQPLVLYPEWDYLVELLDSSNSYHRSASVNILASLTSADKESRFEGVFDQYFRLLDDEKVVTARYVARNAGTIAKHKPNLRAEIAGRLLDIAKTHHKDLICADIIQSLEEFFAASQDKGRILAFVGEQLTCSSPKTRKTAKAFLSKHGK